MNIGQAARASGINAKLIRHYESIGVIPKVGRTEAGYRVYSDLDVHVLRFVKRARGLGFPMKEIKKLVGLWRNQKRASSEVKLLALKHMKELDQKIAELESISKTLKRLAQSCQGDNRSHCPILEELSVK